MALEFILPDWPAPARVKALQTTRSAGVSPAPWASLNLGTHVGDVPARVAENRARLRHCLPNEPVWLNQVHGTRLVDAAQSTGMVEADAAWTTQPNIVCVVMTADCLPVFFCDQAGSVVAVAHAGWRGLLDGVLEATVSGMGVSPANLMAWLGPAIGPDAFEVGPEVRAAFITVDGIKAERSFRQGEGDRWLADIYRLARLRLQRVGVDAVSGGDFCTVSDVDRFFSFRRDGVTGRMASLIWLADV